MTENKMALLPVDCLNEIFENLEEDKITLHSCLLVNHLWCEVSVKILWRNIWSFKYPKHQQRVRSEMILNTLIACLPSESKEILHKNGIFIATPNSKPLFNYAEFCKVLSINHICRIVEEAFKNNPPITSLSPTYRNRLTIEEIVKLFINKISSLKKLIYELGFYYLNIGIPENIPITFIPGESNCLTNLSELNCNSIVHPEFFHHLSQLSSMP